MKKAKTKKQAKFNRKSFILNVLRKASYRYKYANEAVKNARVDRGVYECNACKNRFKLKDLKRDHVSPVVCPLLGFIDWNTYIDRLFCHDSNGYQMLCESCHQMKTNQENKER